MSEGNRLRELFEQLSGRKVFRAAAAYFVGAWLLTEVSATVLPLFGAPESVVRIIVIVLVAFFPIAMILAWAFDVGSGGITRTREPAISSGGARRMDFAIILVLLGVIGYLVFDRFSSPQQGPAPSAMSEGVAPSVAVLPFQNRSTDPANEIFGEGLAEEVLNRLARIEGLQVKARASAFRFRDSDAELAEIGAALSVATILEGSVHAAGDRIRVNANLVDVATGFTIWTQSFNQQLTDVFAIQEEIARQVAQNLRVELLGADPEEETTRPTDNLDAYRLYLRGRSEWHKRTSTSLEEAIALFQQAIDLDPEFAAAWSGLADAYNFLGSYGNMAFDESVQKSEQAARRALELDPDLAEAHASLGLVLQDKMRFEQASRQFRKAVELNPNFAMARTWLGSTLTWIDMDAALEQHRIAAELDPLSPIANQAVGTTLYSLGREEEARQQFLRIIEFAPEFPLVYFQLATIAINRFEYRDAVEYLYKAMELDPGRAATLSVLSGVYLYLGDLEGSARWVEKAEALGPDQVTVIQSRLQLMFAAGDFDGVINHIDERLTRPQDAFLATTYRGAVVYARGEYERAARIFEGVFADIANRQETPNEEYVVADQTMYGLLYLSNALKRSGEEARARDITTDLLSYLDQQAAAGVERNEYAFVRAATLLTRDDREGALATLRAMAEAGDPNHLRIEGDILFEPLRNEVEFKLSIETMRRNAAEQLEQLRQIQEAT